MRKRLYKKISRYRCPVCLTGGGVWVWEQPKNGGKYRSNFLACYSRGCRNYIERVTERQSAKATEGE